MNKAFISGGVLLVAMIESAALAAPVTTDSCLAKGQCAYVSPNGRVTCGPCPGQVIKLPERATAVCRDGSIVLARQSRPVQACTGKGGVGVLLKP